MLPLEGIPWDGNESPKREQPYLDIIFPSDNEWGVPTLDINRQPEGVDLRIHSWGARARSHEKTGLCLFYVDDYRFGSLWSRPYLVSNCGYSSAVEPNVTTSLDSPIAWVLWATYQKRWIARYWQTQGINIFVDLNCPVEHKQISTLGIPRGWRSFMTRGYADRLPALLLEFDLAQFLSESDSPLFVVYGGGSAVRSLCQGKGWIYLAEHQERQKGKLHG
jgi:hypothetical protein